MCLYRELYRVYLSSVDAPIVWLVATTYIFFAYNGWGKDDSHW